MLLLTLLTACPVVDEEPAVEIGTGELDFESLVEGQELAIIEGPQGGFHLLSAIRTKGVEGGDPQRLDNPNNPTITLDVVHDGDSVIIISPFTQGLDEAPQSEAPFTHQMTHRFAILGIDEDDELVGETVVLSVRVDDVNGVTVQDEVTLDLFPHPDNH